MLLIYWSYMTLLSYIFVKDSPNLCVCMCVLSVSFSVSPFSFYLFNSTATFAGVLIAEYVFG